ncbi:hypothetical protein E1091_11635 [Micromonospora fluostatini]|uniref:Uncharacterized protein n=1 Tax=Micromonospora fluostatini TaxID=1629071 RepID=A0ABY2DG47_9ACTN|nr:hypothetical protein E1091_11635 [Micromonospora fluostatini]
MTWSDLRAEARNAVRWLLRRPDPSPPPGSGRCHQAAEQAAAQRRILAQAEAERTPLDDITQAVPDRRWRRGLR